MDPYADSLAQIAANIRAARDAAGLSQPRLAQRAEIDFTTLSRIERGRSDPTARTLLKIARALDTTVSALMRDVG